MARNGKYQYADEVWPEIRKAIRSVNPQAYILAEDWDECSERQQGDAWDSPMNYYGCSRVIRDFYGQPDLFLSRNPVMRDNTRRLSAGDVKNVILSYLAKMPYVFWQNQFNLVDSHDVPRFHNDPSITWKMVRGMAIFLFTLIGCPSVYYGDEAGIDGLPQTNEGCRYPMPWSRDITGTKEYALYHRLIEVRRQNPAFSKGGMQFLYAQGQTLALARQDGESTFVAVISAEEEPTQVFLPLALLGVTEPVSDTDLLGEALTYERMEKGILLTLSPQDAYLFACR
jgi:alpha-glucosidase